MLPPKLQELLNQRSYHSALPLAESLYALSPSCTSAFRSLLSVYFHCNLYHSVITLLDKVPDSLDHELLYFKIASLYKLSKHSEVIELNSSDLPASILLIIGKSLFHLNFSSRAAQVLSQALSKDPLQLECLDLIFYNHLLPRDQFSSLLASLIPFYNSQLPFFSTICKSRIPLPFGSCSVLSSFGDTSQNQMIGPKSWQYLTTGFPSVCSFLTESLINFDWLSSSSQSAIPLSHCLFLSGDFDSLILLSCYFERISPNSSIHLLISSLVSILKEVTGDKPLEEDVSKLENYICNNTSLTTESFALNMVLAHYYVARNQFDCAQTQFKYCHATFPGSILPILCLISLYLQSGVLGYAERFINIASKIDENDLRLFNEKGVYLASIGKLKEAKRVFLSCLELFSDDLLILSAPYSPLKTPFGNGNLVVQLKLSVLSNLALICVRLGEFTIAKNMAETCLLLNPNDEPCLLVLGLAHHYLSNLMDAIDCYQKYLSKVPNNYLAIQLLKLATEEATSL
ncbi:hypothetical protein RCL1_004311 [Eukaryota sp. TZLM3-RCL]